ncbi:PREDICTED: epoxide hydrolase 1-like [Priapulus caudatus]|uniref:Epoxide hydrolase n=1 Tax=Priapulus caudatus TaxID=37621 RepID=A0ABM1E807_PRICU|nr:PREDICTED: epoxide hydrolase 1-like [Priapulus caudatus]
MRISWCCLCLVGVAALVLSAVGLWVKSSYFTPPPPLPELGTPWWGRGPVVLAENNEIRSFTVNFSQEVITDLYERLDRTRYTESLPNVEFQYGVHSDTLKKVVRYWRQKYDVKNAQVELNKYKHFLTEINGIDVHFVHVKPKSSYKNVTPLLMVHGWPGSFYEFYKIIPLLTDPLAHGGKKDDPVFEIICPSIPGYGFSEAAHKKGFTALHASQIFDKLMNRLGHQSYFVQGGDWGSLIVHVMALYYPDRVLGMHTNMPIAGNLLELSYILRVAIGSVFPSLVFEEKELWKVYPCIQKLTTLWEEMGYYHVQSTKPDTTGVGLNNSPVGLAAWILEKFSTWTSLYNRNNRDGGLATQTFTLDELLHNVMIYWVTESITTSMRFYKEFVRSDTQSYLLRKYTITVPVAYAVFPNELVHYPECIATSYYPNLVQYTDMPRGGHFPAFEEPELLADDVRNFVAAVQADRKLKKEEL